MSQQSRFPKDRRPPLRLVYSIRAPEVAGFSAIGPLTEHRNVILREKNYQPRRREIEQDHPELLGPALAISSSCHRDPGITATAIDYTTKELRCAAPVPRTSRLIGLAQQDVDAVFGRREHGWPRIAER